MRGREKGSEGRVRQEGSQKKRQGRKDEGRETVTRNRRWTNRREREKRLKDIKMKEGRKDQPEGGLGRCKEK